MASVETIRKSLDTNTELRLMVFALLELPEQEQVRCAMRLTRIFNLPTGADMKTALSAWTAEL